MYPMFSAELAADRLREARGQAERRRLVSVLRASALADQARLRAQDAADRAERESVRLVEVTLALVTS